jgi:hypothetical protein
MTFIINHLIFLLVSIATHALIAIIIIIHNIFFQKKLNFIKAKIYVLHVIVQYDFFHFFWCDI